MPTPLAQPDAEPILTFRYCGTEHEHGLTARVDRMMVVDPSPGFGVVRFRVLCHGMTEDRPIGCFVMPLDHDPRPAVSKAIDRVNAAAVGDGSHDQPALSSSYWIAANDGRQRLASGIPPGMFSVMARFDPLTTIADAFEHKAMKHPFAALAIKLQFEGGSFIWTATNIGRAPMSIANPVFPRRSDLPAPSFFGVMMAERAPGSRYDDLPWKRLAIPQQDNAPERVTIDPGKALSYTIPTPPFGPTGFTSKAIFHHPPEPLRSLPAEPLPLPIPVDGTALSASVVVE